MGRIPTVEETPAELAIELTDSLYRALGSEVAVAVADARQALIDALPTAESGALPFEGETSLMAALAGKAKRTAVQQALEGLLSEQMIRRTGAGKKNNPYRYWLVENSAADSADTATW